MKRTASFSDRLYNNIEKFVALVWIITEFYQLPGKISGWDLSQEKQNKENDLRRKKWQEQELQACWLPLWGDPS